MSLNKYVPPPGGRPGRPQTNRGEISPPKKPRSSWNKTASKKKKKKSVDVYIILILSAVCWRCFQAFIVCGFVSVLFLALVFERWKYCLIGRCHHLSCVCDVVLPPESAGGGRKMLRLDCKSGLGCQERRLTGGYGGERHLKNKTRSRNNRNTKQLDDG